MTSSRGGAITGPSSRRAPVEHHRHLNEQGLGAFWRKLDDQGARITTIAATLLREHGFGRDVVELLLAHGE